MRQVIWCVLLLSSAIFANGNQQLVVTGDEPLAAVLSGSDFSKISMGNGRKVHQVMAEQGFITVTNEPKSGTAIVRPSPKAPDRFSVFVKDDLGKLYTLAVRVRDVPAQTLVIQAPSKARAHTKVQGRHSELRQSTNALLKAMYLEQEPHGFVVQSMDTPVPLWEEARIRLVQTYQGGHKTGYVYELKNVSKNALKLHESEFMNMVPDAIAVGIQNATVNTGQKTHVYVVSHGGES